MLAALAVTSWLATSAAGQPAHLTLRGANGAAQLELGVAEAPLQGDLSRAARAFALARRAELKLPATSTLGEATVLGTRFGASVHLPQVVHGVEVYRAKVVVTVDAQRRVRQVSSSAADYGRAVLEWSTPAERALRLAAEVVRLPRLQPSGMPFGGTRRVLFPVGTELHAGYLAFVPSVDLLEQRYVAVDAVTGEVLWSENRVFHASDDAEVYALSPGGLQAGVGVAPLTAVKLKHQDGRPMVRADAGGYLSGDQIDTYNCCPNQDCAVGAGAKPRTEKGQLSFRGFPIQYEVSVCDRLQRSTNDVAFSPAGNYVFPPLDPPAPGKVSQAEPADSDAFAEVHAFYHVNNIFDWVRGLSAAAAPLFPGENVQPFKMRDERLVPARRPAVWTNVTVPDMNELMQSFNPFTGAKATSLMRVDNAAFLAKENLDQLLLPTGYPPDVDTLLLFQGNQADFAYDAPVVWHEFGHGIIHATAAFASFTVDERSANNEGGALHEGVADYLAGAFGNTSKIGEYVGPRIQSSFGGGQLQQDAALRDLENTHRCPEVLEGEVHQDSKHVAGALWEGRRELDNGPLFDAAVYAALASMTPATDFAQAAEIVSAHVGQAFPADTKAGERMKTIFQERGVLGCSKVLEPEGLTAERASYGIGGTDAAKLAPGTVMPGPYQLRFALPDGATSLKLTATVQEDPTSALTGAQHDVRLLAKLGAPVTFTRVGANGLKHDAELTATASVAGGKVTAELALDAACGDALFLTLATAGRTAERLADVKVTVTPGEPCVVEEPPPAPPPAPVEVPAVQEQAPIGPAAPAGCGCGATHAGQLLWASAVLLGLARRRRRA